MPVRLALLLTLAVFHLAAARHLNAQVGAPVITVSPASGTVVTSSPIPQVRIDWCDPNDLLIQHSVTWQGQTLPDVFTVAKKAGCVGAGYSIYSNLAINPGTQSLVATAGDNSGNVVTATSTITYNPPPPATYQPRVLATAGQHALPGPNAVASADTFTVRNDGTATATYSVVPLCSGSATLGECSGSVGSTTVAPGATQPVIVYYTRSGTLDYADTLKLVASYTSSSQTFADTGRKVVIAGSVYTPTVTRYGTQSTSANGRRSWTFSIRNGGNAIATYTLAVSCSGALTSCTLPNSGTTMSATIYPGEWSNPVVTFNTGAIGTSGQLKFVMTAPPRPLDGVVQADSSTVTFNAADLASPTLTFEPFWSGTSADGNLIVSADTATVYLNVCDTDGTLGIPTFKVSGATYTAISNVATTASGCFSSRRLAYKPVFLDGYGDVTASVSDGYHTGSKQIWYQHDGAPENTPVITALHPSISVPVNTASSDTFVVSNQGHQTLTYPLTATCSPYSIPASCSMSSGYASVTLAPGASVRVPVAYTVAGVGTAVTATLSSAYYGAFDTTTARASFTATAVGTIPPTIAVSPANGSTVTSSPISQLRIDWCDADDALTRHDVVWQGQAMPNTYVATTRSGCYAAGTSTYTNVPIDLWQQSLVATATDVAGHTTTSTTTITFAPPLTSFAPKVTTTPDWHLLSSSGAATAADTFTIKNNGSYTTSYALTLLCGTSSTLSGCAKDKGAVSLAAGASDQVVVTYTRSGAADVTDTLKLVAAYTSPIGGVIADTGRKVVMAPSIQPAPVVKPTQSTYTLSPNIIMAAGWFTLRNTGTSPTRYRLTYTVTGGFSIRSALDTITVQPGQTLSSTAAIAAPSAAGVSGTLTLTASYATLTGQSVSASATLSLTTSSGTISTTTIAVAGASAPLLAPNGVSSVAFTVTNTGSASAIVSYARACAGSAIAVCGSLNRQLDSLAANQSAVVTVNVTAASSFGQTGAVTLTATAAAATSAASTVNLAIGIVNGPVAMMPVALLNPGTSIARDQCLTIAAGDLAAYECGDLRLVHPLPTTTTMNKARTPTLIYMSAHARPVTLVATDVAVDGTICPTQVVATVRFSSVADTAQRAFAWNGPCGQRSTRRIVVPVDAVANGHATGIYKYKLEIQAVANGTRYTVVDTAGVMAVVNRSSSQFGPGWWVDGVEQLIAVTNPDQLLWVGGDGSTRLYTRQPGTSTYLVQPAVDRPDTLEQLSGGAGYRRHLRNGAYVEFDGTLRHVTTVNVAGHRTQLYWHSNQLDSISLPVADPNNALARRTYRFAYTAGLFSSLDSPGPAGRRLTTLSRGAQSGGTDFGIVDPGSLAVHYISDATGRITVRRNRLGDGTRYDYDPATGAVTRVAVDLTRTSGTTDSIRTGFCPGEASSVGPCAGALTDPVAVRTLVDGPRTDVADTTAFYLTAFGAPQRIMDALGHATSIERGDPRWPLLATATVLANGHRVEATYTDRGLVAEVRDINPFGRDTNEIARTQYQWNSRFDKIDNVTAPTGEVTRFGYLPSGDRQWQEDGRGSVSRTWFTYNDNRQLASVQPPGNGSSALQRLAYDPASGNLVREITPLNDTTFYHNDAIGRVDSVASPANDSQQRSESFVFDVADRLIVHRAIGPAVSTARGTAPAVTLVDSTAYDLEGRSTSVFRRSVPDSAFVGILQTDWTYDAAGRRLREQHAGGSDQRWTYDPAGNPITWTTGRYSDGVPVVVSTAYDALNRPLHRTIPEVRRPAERGEVPICMHGPRFPYFSYLTSGPTYDPTAEGNCDTSTPLPQPLVIPADAADFTYDEVGNLRAATNNDARVTRDYYPNGALKSETQAIAIFDDLTPLDARFNTHRYRLDYAYDLSGRRITRTDGVPGCDGCVQTYHYDAVSGFMDAITDGGAGRAPAQFNFQYDSAGRMRVWTVNGGRSSTELSYDANGRLESRNVIGAGTLIYHDQLTYDRSGRITATSITSDLPEIAGSTTSVYNGLGALATFSQTRNGTLLDDEFVTDGLGNRVSDKRWVDAHYTTHRYHYTRELLDRVSQMTPWQVSEGQPPLALQKGDTATTNYGGTAAVEYQHRAGFVFNTLVNAWQVDTLGDEWTWHAYGADERLRVSQRSVQDPQTITRTVFTDYRYDALGRRVAVRTRWDPYCQRAEPECLSTIERTIWDGDQILMELRSPAATEVEYAWGNFTGSVRYTHGAGIDEPLAIWKDEIGGVIPHRSWRGTYEDGTPIDQSSGNVTWPARTQDVFHAPDARFDAIQPTNWIGSIVDGKTDPSGLQYMRNRYYDPRSGRFTQEDPIGLAGGMNLYGFGGGDPVNQSDPFGLCPTCIGAAAGVAEGFLLAKLLGQEYTWKQAAADAALGAVGAGLAERLYEIGKVARGAEAAEEGLGVVYRRINPRTGEEYIGRSKSEAGFLRRQATHDRHYGVSHEYEIIDRAKNGRSLRAAEESAIRRNGGPGKLANKRYEMNDAAYRDAGGSIPKP